ncbi:hypothetical protein [Xanthomonas medicagonis]|uniref:hypothetical protein n=1 Tax=Xanthomonas medicagonis TaxID=3160841 RepID=UPI003519C4D6
MVHERTFGATANHRRDAAEAAHDTRVVTGARMWFQAHVAPVGAASAATGLTDDS